MNCALSIGLRPLLTAVISPCTGCYKLFLLILYGGLAAAMRQFHLDNIHFYYYYYYFYEDFHLQTGDIPIHRRRRGLADCALEILGSIGLRLGLRLVFSARCNIHISRLCFDVSVRLSVRLSVT